MGEKSVRFILIVPPPSLVDVTIGEEEEETISRACYNILEMLLAISDL